MTSCSLSFNRSYSKSFTGDNYFEHRSLFTPTFAAEAPSFIEAPQRELTVAEGQTAILKCRVFGAPKPTILWQKGDQFEDVLELDEGHFNVLDNGDLQIVVSFKLLLTTVIIGWLWTNRSCPSWIWDYVQWLWWAVLSIVCLLWLPFIRNTKLTNV